VLASPLSCSPFVENNINDQKTEVVDCNRFPAWNKTLLFFFMGITISTRKTNS